MAVTVPSLEGQLYLTDPQSIIGYTLRRYSRQPADTIPILSDMIISLPAQISTYGQDPSALANNIQNDLQGVFTRIFQTERSVTVTVNPTQVDNNFYNITVSIIYTMLSGELQQTGTTLALRNGRLTIPEDQIDWVSSPYDAK